MTLDESIERPSMLGQVLAQRYCIEEELGAGGMGVVYRARHVHMQHSVALKVLRKEFATMDQAVQRFAREAIAGGKIRHPNVVTATDFGTLDDGSYYLVLDYVDGQTLSRTLKQDGALTLARALGIARQIASALEAAHAVGVSHRDLKPGNVMLVNAGSESEHVKVIDFGLAGLAQSDSNGEKLTKYGTVFGTPEYMAPEQAAGRETGPHSDLYALGVILYELLTGVSPFAGGDLLAVLTRQVLEMPPELPYTFSRRLRQLVVSLLAKAPEERPPSASVVIFELDEVLKESTSAGAESGRDRRALVRQLQVRTFESFAWFKRAFAQQINVGARRVSLGRIALVAAGLGCVLAIALVMRLGRKGSELDPALDPVRAGDPVAIAAAEKRPDTDNPEYWLALGHGYFNGKSVVKGLDAYDKAFALQNKLAAPTEVSRDLYELLRQKDLDAGLQTRGLEFCEKTLGATGADVLYELTRDGSLSVELAAATKRALERARPNASAALKILLEMNEAKNCDALKELLPRAIAEADQRAAEFLRKRSNARGCGFLRRRDCYPCLRGSDALAQALKAATSRARPVFAGSTGAPAPTP